MTTLLLTSYNFIKTLAIHLWMATTSVKFYERVFNNYKGYGVKYILVLSIFSSLMVSTLFLYKTNHIKLYLSNDIISSKKIQDIDYISNQFPIIEYDGKSISTKEPNPIFLKSFNDYKIVAIDLDNKQTPNEKSRIPFVLNKNHFIINLFDLSGSVIKSFSIKYTDILGDQPITLTQNDIKSIALSIIDKSSFAFIPLFFSALTGMIFFSSLLDKMPIIFLIYIFSQLNSKIIPLKTCIRIVLFASGIFVLLQYIISITYPSMIFLLWFIQSWSNFLMILAILRIFGKTQFSFFNK